MALVFPLVRAAFMDRLRVSEQSFRLQRQEEFSGLGSGEIIAAEIAPPRWVTDVSLSTMTSADAVQIEALIEALGSSNRAYLYDMARRYPAGDPDGTILGGGAGVVISGLGGNGRSLRLSGLPVGYVVTTGDQVAAPYGAPARRALFRASETVTANGAGQTPLFDVQPHIPVGLSIGAGAELKKPFAAFILNSFDRGVDDVQGMRTGMRFSAIQVPR